MAQGNEDDNPNDREQEGMCVDQLAPVERSRGGMVGGEFPLFCDLFDLWPERERSDAEPQPKQRRHQHPNDGERKQV